MDLEVVLRWQSAVDLWAGRCLKKVAGEKCHLKTMQRLLLSTISQRAFLLPRASNTNDGKLLRTVYETFSFLFLSFLFFGKAIVFENFLLHGLMADHGNLFVA